MDVMEQTDRSHYEADLERIASIDAPDWLKAIREAGAARFADLEFPHYKQEAWRFTNISPIIKTQFHSVLAKPADEVPANAVSAYFFDAPDWPQLVFVDGFFADDLSRTAALPEGVRIGSLAQAVAEGDEVVQAHLGKYVDTDDAFIALNNAFLQDGAFVHVPNNTILETPLHFIFVSTGAETTASYPRNLIVIGDSAQAVTIETYVGLSDAAVYLTNGVEEVVLGDNATLRRHKVVLEGDAAYHLGTTKVVQGRDSTLRSFEVSLTGQIVRNALNVSLAGEGGQTILNGIYLNDRDRLIDNALNVTHTSPHCYSRMGYKGVLDGTSRSVFTGRVLVPPKSQQTDSDQLNNNLLLSDTATIDTKPQLEIFADDVKCTHGATIGGFPQELTFYFQSRGMTAAMANAILTYGFASEIVDEIEVGPLKKRLSDYVFNKYTPKSGE